ncbi:MAG: protein TolR [Alphaproteobacteria bacterium]
MAFNIDMSRRGGGRSRYRPLAEINVTPMVDVMLVLLVVFMVTAPLLTVGVPVDLPKTAAAPLSEQTEPVVVSVNGEGQIFLQDTKIEFDQLVPRLTAIVGAKADTRIFVRGDRGIAYGRVIEIMGALRTAGFDRIALVTEMPQTPVRR